MKHQQKQCIANQGIHELQDYRSVGCLVSQLPYIGSAELPLIVVNYGSRFQKSKDERAWSDVHPAVSWSFPEMDRSLNNPFPL